MPRSTNILAHGCRWVTTPFELLCYFSPMRPIIFDLFSSFIDRLLMRARNEVVSHARLELHYYNVISIF